MKHAKCPICGGFDTEWLGIKDLKETKTRYLVWCCGKLDDNHWARGSIFLSDLQLNSLSMEESDEIREAVYDEEMEELDKCFGE